MNSIKIINPGLLTTIQDQGRIGYQQFGVPQSGVMDYFAFQLANILVGNNRTEAVIEITMLGPKILFECDIPFAITGGELSPKINGKEVAMYKTVFAKKGDILEFAGIKSGCRAYLAIAGGLDIPEVMGSKSTYLRGEIGGFEGRKLKQNDVIKINTEKINYGIGIREIPKDLIPGYKNQTTIRVIMDKEQNFQQEGIETFLQSEYTLTDQCDRMGFRLEGPTIKHTKGPDIISAGINFGAIQVPGHGQPIIMMADRQTTGGYTLIGNVISVDLPYLSQLKPGDKVKFQKISIEEAQSLFQEREDKLNKLLQGCLEQQSCSNYPMRNYLIRVSGKEYNVVVQQIS